MLITTSAEPYLGGSCGASQACCLVSASESRPSRLRISSVAATAAVMEHVLHVARLSIRAGLPAATWAGCMCVVICEDLCARLTCDPADKVLLTHSLIMRSSRCPDRALTGCVIWQAHLACERAVHMRSADKV